MKTRGPRLMWKDENRDSMIRDDDTMIRDTMMSFMIHAVNSLQGMLS